MQKSTLFFFLFCVPALVAAQTAVKPPQTPPKIPPVDSNALCVRKLASIAGAQNPYNATLVTNDAGTQLVTYHAGVITTTNSGKSGSLRELVSSKTECLNPPVPGTLGGVQHRTNNRLVFDSRTRATCWYSLAAHLPSDGRAEVSQTTSSRPACPMERMSSRTVSGQRF